MHSITAWAAVVISVTNLTSAGQFSALSLMLESASLLELALSQFIINLRYALMSLSLTQKVDKHMKTYERALIAYGVTDEIFALASSTYERVGKWYMSGIGNLSNSYGALDFFSEGNQKFFYKIISFLCTLCGVRRNDLPSHFYQRRQCSGIYCRLFDSLISGIQR